MSKTHKDQRKHRRKVGRSPAGLLEHLKRQKRQKKPRVQMVWRTKSGGIGG